MNKKLLVLPLIGIMLVMSVSGCTMNPPLSEKIADICRHNGYDKYWYDGSCMGCIKIDNGSVTSHRPLSRTSDGLVFNDYSNCNPTGKHLFSVHV